MLFGVLIVVAVACCLLYWKLTWRRTAAWCTALLWLDVALLMLLGAGKQRQGKQRQGRHLQSLVRNFAVMALYECDNLLRLQIKKTQAHPLSSSCRLPERRICGRLRFLQVRRDAGGRGGQPHD